MALASCYVDDSDFEFLSQYDSWDYWVNWEAYALRLKITCLGVVLRLGGTRKHNNNLLQEVEEHLQDVLDHMSRVFQLVVGDLKCGVGNGIAFIRNPSKQFPAGKSDDRLLISRNLERLDLLNPDIKLFYHIISSKSSSLAIITRTILESVRKNLTFFLTNIGALLIRKHNLFAAVKEDLVAAQHFSRFLRNFLLYTSKRCNELAKLKDLANHAQFVLGNLSCLLYLRSAHNKNMVPDDVLNKFCPAQPEVGDIYIKALKASKSVQPDSAVLVDMVDLDFLDSLRDYILEHPDIKVNSMASDKDHILYLHQELQFLTLSYVVYKSSEAHMERKLDQIYNYFLEHITSAIADMGFLACSLHHNEQSTADKAKVLKVAFSDLQDFIKNAKEDARKAYAAYIPKSRRLKTKFQNTDAQSIMDSLSLNMKIAWSLEKFYRQVPPITWHLIQVYEKEMQSLIEAFRELNAKQQYLDRGNLETQMTCLKEIRSKTSYYLCRRGIFWFDDLWLFDIIVKIKMVKLEFKDLQNQMIHDSSASKMLGKINLQGKNDGTHSGAIFENEAELPTNVGLREMDAHNNNLDMVCPMKDEVKALRLKAGFLKVFLSCKGMWLLQDESLKLLLNHIHSVFQSAEQDLQGFSPDSNIQTSLEDVHGFPMNENCILSRVLSRHQLLETDMLKIYFIITESSRFITSISDDDALIEYPSTLLENIEVLEKCITQLSGPLKQELQDVEKSLRFLRNFLGFTAKRCSSLWILKDLVIHSELLTGNISCLLYLCCHSERMSDQVINEMKVHLSSEMQKICPAQAGMREIYVKALKASKSAKGNSYSAVLDEYISGFLDSLCDHILELSDNNLNFIASVKEEILSLLGEMKFMITFFTMGRSSEEHPEHDQMSSSLFQHVNLVIIDVGCFIYLLNDSKNNEEIAQELNKKVSDLDAKMVAVKEDIRKFYDLYFPRQLQSDFPRTNGQGFLGSFFQKLNELLNTKPNPVAPLNHHIEIVQKELLSLRKNFDKITKQPEQCDNIQAQWFHFLDIAYQTEFIVDSFLVGGDPIYYHQLGFFNVIEEVKTIQVELKAIKTEMTEETTVQKPSHFSSQVLVQSYSPKINAVFSSKEGLVEERSMTKPVIFEEEAEKIREHLTSTSPKLNIISIVGMPGIGKTTLADTMFQHSSIIYHFHIRARCSVSQIHDKRRLLLEILQHISTNCREYSDYEDLLQELYQNLKGRRYLILMDDLWDIQPWKDINASLPDDENGSRIIFTSRSEGIAKQSGLVGINCRLSPLSEEKSWEMLKVKLFENRSCPVELESFGREIAANCKGVPLTIDLVAGILRMKEIKEWTEVAENLMTLVFEDPEGRCQKVLELSYQNLPDDVKPCFLYFSAFPEDANMPTRDLILFWIGEGFVKPEKDEQKSLEDAAGDVLNNLISRGLVTVTWRGPLGGVSGSRVHDLLHEFAVAKAKEERFMEKIDVKAQWKELNGKSYRLCIHPFGWEKFMQLNPSGLCIRALIFTSLHEYPQQVNFSDFKLLRILYVPKVSGSGVFKLIHLRVLTIGSIKKSEKFKFVSKIHKLQNLESFKIVNPVYFQSDFLTDPFLLLDKICSMVRLRHFDCGDYISFRYCSEKIWEMSSPLDNLRTLKCVRVSYEEDTEKILKLMPNIVELKLLFYNPDGGCYPFPNLDFLKKLEILEVENEDYMHIGMSCVTRNLPTNLKKLIVSNFRWQWTQISEIGNLKYLEYLDLRMDAWQGPIWNMIDGQFPKLKYLSLSFLDIEEWNATEDHLPCLEQLHLLSLENLKMLPSCLAQIATLQLLRLLDCTDSAVISANMIREEQEETGNEQLAVEYGLR